MNRAETKRRTDQIWQLKTLGLSPREIQSEVGCSIDVVYRSISEIRRRENSIGAGRGKTGAKIRSNRRTAKMGENFSQACTKAREVLSDNQWHGIERIRKIAQTFQCDADSILDQLYCAEHTDGSRYRWVAIVNDTTPDEPTQYRK